MYIAAASGVSQILLADSMTWDSQQYLTPSPESHNCRLLTTEKLAYYATPPLSPAIAGPLSGYSYTDKAVTGMDGSGIRQFHQTAYQLPREYGHLQENQHRYLQTTSQPQQHITRPTSRATLGAGQGLYPGYGQGQAMTNLYSTEPQMQDTSLGQYDNSSFNPSVNQRHASYNPAYSSALMLNNTSAAPSIQTVTGQQGPGEPSAYDSVQQYPPRQSSTTIDVLANQFGVGAHHPGVTPQQYYNAVSDASSAPGYSAAAAAANQYQGHHLHQQHQHQQQQQQQHSYHPQQPAALSSQHRAGTSTAPYHQAGISYQPSGSLATNMTDSSAATVASFYADSNYQAFTDLARKSFHYTQEGKLSEAHHTVLELSEWLMKSLQRFGLTKDDATRKPQRLQLWKDFNHTWLSLLQAQKDATSPGANPSPPPRSLLTIKTLKEMGDELVRICDQVEGDGLVDYEMGIWEEEIMSVLLDCVQILEGSVPGSPSATRTQMLSKSRRLS